MCLCSSYRKNNTKTIACQNWERNRLQVEFPNIFGFHLFKSLYFSLVLFDSLLPHHDLLLVFLQLILLIVYLDAQAGLLGLKLQTKATWYVPGLATEETKDNVERTDLFLNSPLLCNLILSLHLFLLKLSDVPYTNLLTEFNKHLILHLENRSICINVPVMLLILRRAPQ